MTKVFFIGLLIFVAIVHAGAQIPLTPEKDVPGLEEVEEIKPDVDALLDTASDPLSSSGLTASDTAPYFEDHIIKSRLQAMEGVIPLTFNHVTRGFIDYFTIRNRAYTRLMLQRVPVYFPLFEAALKKHNMPEELKYLAVVESGLHPRAISRVGAAGLWQFMPYTGKTFDLQQDFFVDDRLDPAMATEAACLYLKQLYYMFGDWELAIASYNCGPGNVRKAIRRSGGKRSFWKIYPFLPKETRSYLPQFIALAYALHFHEAHLLQPEGHEVLPETDTLFVDHTVHFNALAFVTGLCLEDLIKLNPAVKHGLVPAGHRYKVVVPTSVTKNLHELYYCLFDTLNCFPPLDLPVSSTSVGWFSGNQNFGSTLTGKYKITHRVKSGESLGSIAMKHKVTVTQIKQWNKLQKNTIYPGQRLAVWKSQSQTIPGRAPKIPATVVSQPTSGSTAQFHKVEPGDTLWSIATRYEITVQRIKEWNKLQSNTIKSGMKLRVG
jgi:membrane-bound lytic murein transglycosylase D